MQKSNVIIEGIVVKKCNHLLREIVLMYLYNHSKYIFVLRNRSSLYF